MQNNTVLSIKNILNLSILAICLLFLFINTAFAQNNIQIGTPIVQVNNDIIKNTPIIPNNISMIDKSVQKKIEDYLTYTKTIEADFTEVIPGQKDGVGKLYIDRPAYFLWQYESPVKQKIISPDSRTFYMNEETNQITQIPSTAGPLSLLNAKIVTLNNKQMRLDRAFKLDNEYIATVSLIPEENPNVTVKSITIIIKEKSDKTLSISSIQTVDNTGYEAYVSFKNVKQGLKIPKSVFNFTIPGEEVFHN